MFVLTRKVGQSILIEDVQLKLQFADNRSIIFTMEKISGGRETKVRIQKHQIVDVCYDVKLQVISVNANEVRFGLEHPPNISIQRLNDTFPEN